MNRKPISHWALVFVASWATALPQLGYTTETAIESHASLPALTMRDVELDTAGDLHGTLTSAEGQPLKATELIVRQNGEVLSKAQSQVDGRFVIHGLRPGLYELNTTRFAGLFRVWAPRSAPPSAQTNFLVVEGETVIRAQQWNAWRRALILSGVIITSGVIGGVIGYNIKDDAS